MDRRICYHRSRTAWPPSGSWAQMGRMFTLGLSGLLVALAIGVLQTAVYASSQTDVPSQAVVRMSAPGFVSIPWTQHRTPVDRCPRTRRAW